MTHDILRSDIELATRLLAEKRPDDKIIGALAHRGVDPAKAVQLVDDLRNRRKVGNQADPMIVFASARRSRAHRASPEARQEQSSRSSSKVESRPSPRRHAADHHQNKSAVSWLAAALVVVLVLVVGGIVLRQRQLAAANSAETRMPGTPPIKIDSK